MSWTSLRPRSIAAGLGLLATVSLLSACSKPQPTVTVLSNDKSKIIPAQPTCTMLTTPCALVNSKIKHVTASAGSKILVDVPRSLANGGWIVTAYITDGKKNTALTTPGAQSGTIQGQHSVRLTVPSATEGSYFLQVTALRPSDQLTTWVIGVNLTQ
jgi:hypothetical protein